MASCCEEKKTIRAEGEKKDLTVRINRIAGQMNGIKKMIEEDRYCDDILIQLAAVDKAVKSLAAVVLEKHMHNCIVAHLQQGDLSVVDELVDLFKKFQ